MDRTPQTPDEFDALRRLLALKRHEKPPPGFFEDFSARVMSRTDAEEQLRSQSFLDRFAALFHAGRVFAPTNLIAAAGFVFVGASLFLVLNERGANKQPLLGQGAGAIAEPRAAGWLPQPQPPPQPAWEQYVVLHLAPAPKEPDTNEVPKDLFTLPSMRQVQGVRADTPQLLLPPR